MVYESDSGSSSESLSEPSDRLDFSGLDVIKLPGSAALDAGRAKFEDGKVVFDIENNDTGA